MRNGAWRKLGIGLGILTAALAGGNLARAADEPKDSRQLTIRLAEPNATQDAKAEAPNRYWIGVMCVPASEALHAQLPELPKDQGVVVEQIVPDGPAAKAGLKINDILFAIGDTVIHQTAELSNGIEAAKGAEISIKLFRGGKVMTVAVKPEEQKIDVQTGTAVRVPLGADAETVQKWVQQMNPAAGSPQPFNVRIIRAGPGVMLPPGVAAKPELPDDMSVDIHREGKKPAKITVKKGVLKWEVTEDELVKLPDEVRRQVEPFVAGGPVRLELAGQMAIPAGPIAVAGAAPADVLVRNPADSQNRLEQRIDALSKRVDELQATINELRGPVQRRDAPSTPQSDKPRE